MIMTITVYRYIHFKDEQIKEKFKRLFGESDIIFFEKATSIDYDNVKETYQKISDTDAPSASDLGFTYKKKPILEHLHGSGKKVEMEKSRVSINSSPKFYNAMKCFYNGDLENSCKLFIQGAKLFAQETTTRDKDIPEQLIEIKNDNKGKKILAAFGAAHTFYYDLKKRGLDVRQEFYNKPHIFGFDEELMRRIRFNKPYDKTDVARAVANPPLDVLFIDLLGYKSSDSTKMSRRILEKLSYEDIEELSKYLSSPERKQFLSEHVGIWLEKRGFEL